MAAAARDSPPVEDMLAGLTSILGGRGLQLVRESRKALQRGLFVASSSLLAAASEAAWFNLARSVPDPGEKLLRLIDDGRDVAEVIRLTELQLLALKRAGKLVTDHEPGAPLPSHPKLRALHPIDEHDQEREVWLSETGATLLTISARRYFVKMARLEEMLSGPAE